MGVLGGGKWARTLVKTGCYHSFCSWHAFCCIGEYRRIQWDFGTVEPEWVEWVVGISMDTRPRSPRRGN